MEGDQRHAVCPGRPESPARRHRGPLGDRVLHTGCVAHCRGSRECAPAGRLRAETDRQHWRCRRRRFASCSPNGAVSGIRRGVGSAGKGRVENRRSPKRAPASCGKRPVEPSRSSEDADPAAADARSRNPRVRDSRVDPSRRARKANAVGANRCHTGPLRESGVTRLIPRPYLLVAVRGSTRRSPVSRGWRLPSFSYNRPEIHPRVDVGRKWTEPLPVRIPPSSTLTRESGKP